MSNEAVKKSQIRIDVNLDKENLPISIEWDADDSDVEGKQAAKAMMLSMFDGINQNSMRIDLWTNELKVDEMNLFTYQTLSSLVDTFERATNNKELADEMRDFVHHFGHKADVFGPEHKH